ncbi:4804_t:CDS:2, partial [Dentiscutata heterogama]
TTDTESEMNCVWEKIATGIIHAANKNIPRKKVSKKKIGLRIGIDDRDEINILMEKFNLKHGTKIPQTTSYIDKTWHEDLVD